MSPSINGVSGGGIFAFTAIGSGTLSKLKPSALLLSGFLPSSFHAGLAPAVAMYYDKVRLRILMGIASTTPDGYRANDARFLIGAIYWNQQRTKDALHWWRQLTMDPTDSHASTYAQIISALHLVEGSATGDPERQEAALKAQITRILSHDYGRWLMFSVDRLWQFGYRFNTY